MPGDPRYEDDFFAWTPHQAAVLRALRTDDNRFDRDHVAEEIEDLGRSERDAVRSQVRRIIEHLLTLAYSPAQEARYDWMASIAQARAELSDKFSASLRRDVEVILDRLYRDGRRPAELGLRRFGEDQAADRLPPDCPYTLDEICRDDGLPGAEDRAASGIVPPE